MPKQYFYVNHVDGDDALFAMFADRVQALQYQILAFAREYMRIGAIDSYAKFRLKKARIKTFVDFMKSPKYQAQFTSGLTKVEICQTIYDSHKEAFALDAIKDDVVENAPSKFEKKRTKQIAAARDEKYASQFEPESLVIELTQSTVVSGLFVFAGLLAWFAFHRLCDFATKVETELESSSAIVKRVLKNWDPKVWIDNIVPSDPKVMLLLIELKTLVHVIYEWQYGTRSGMLSWASNFLITRTKDFVSSLRNVLSILPMRVTEPQVGQFQPETKAMEDFISMLSSFAANYKIQGLTPENIRLANAEFAYLNNVQKQAKDVINGIKNVISVICRVIFSFDPFDSYFQEFSYKLLLVIEYVSRWDMKPPQTHEDMELVLSQYERYKGLAIDEQMSHVPNHLKSLFMAKFSRLEQLASECSNTLRGDVRRVEPVVILLSGAPGSGKTQAANAIKKCISKTVGDKTIDNFSVNLKSEYFEGYRNQRFVTCDEFFSTTSVDDRRIEATSLINMTNTTPYNLNMAFGEKGKKFFNSEYIIITSNHLRPDSGIDAGLTDSAAFERRMHIKAYRDDPYCGSIVDNTFTIWGCDLFPEYVGAKFNAGQLANLMLEIHKIHKRYYDTAFDQSEEFYDLATNDDFRLPNSLPPQATSVRGSMALEPDLFDPEDFTECMLDAANYLELFTRHIAGDYYDHETIEILSIIFMIFGTVAIVTYMFSGTVDDFDPESHDDRVRRRNPKANRHKKEKQQKRTFRRGGMEVQNETVLDESFGRVESCVIGFQAKYIKDDIPYVTSCVGHHIKNSYYMIPGHFYDDVSGTHVTEFTVFTAERAFVMDFPDETEFFGPGDLDVLFVHLVLPQQPVSMYNYLCEETSSQVENFVEGSLAYLLGRSNSSFYVKKAIKSRISKNMDYAYGSSHYYLESPICYEADTNRGDSGCAVVVKLPTDQVIVLGIHSGRNIVSGVKLGCALPITKELVDEVFNHFEVQSNNFPLVPCGSVVYGVPVATHSRIKRSSLYGYAGPPIFIPARMSSFLNEDRELVNPAFKAIGKLHQEFTQPSDIPQEVMTYLQMYYPRDIRYQQVFTFEQAVNGCPELNAPSICATTSPGYPFCLPSVKGVSTPTKGKAPWITNVEDRYVCSPELIDIVNKGLSSLRQGYNIDVIWTNDETG